MPHYQKRHKSRTKGAYAGKKKFMLKARTNKNEMLSIYQTELL